MVWLNAGSPASDNGGINHANHTEKHGVASESSITVGEKETDWLDAMDRGYGGKDVLPDEIAPSFDYRNISTLEAAKSEQKQ